MPIILCRRNEAGRWQSAGEVSTADSGSERTHIEPGRDALPRVRASSPNRPGAHYRRANGEGIPRTHTQRREPREPKRSAKHCSAWADGVPFVPSNARRSAPSAFATHTAFQSSRNCSTSRTRSLSSSWHCSCSSNCHSQRPWMPKWLSTAFRSHFMNASKLRP